MKIRVLAWLAVLGLFGSAVGGADIRGAVLWLDAADSATFGYDVGGAVATWTSKDATRRVAHAVGNLPQLAKTPAGLPAVDFGRMGSGCDLRFPRLTGVRTAVLVGRFTASRFCHFLCDATPGGEYAFHRGDDGAYCDSTFAKVARVWNGTSLVEDPDEEILSGDSFQVVCIELRQGASVDSLTNDRQFHGRNGGRALCEVLVYDRVLSEAERLDVIRQLQAKWKIKDSPTSCTTRNRDWNLIARDIANWDKKIPKCAREQAANVAACILPGDRDPLDVALRRARALVDDLAGEVDLAAEKAELSSLAAKAGDPRDAAARLAVFRQVQALVRRTALKNPRLKGIHALLFVAHEPPGFNEWNDGSHMCDQYYGFHGTQNGFSRGDGLYVLENPFSDRPTVRNLLAGKTIEAGPWKGQTLDGCAIISPDIDWDGKRIAFAAVRNNAKRDVWSDETCYHVFTCDIDGNHIRQLTTGGFNEFDPCWLPNGRILFTSERRGGFVRCSGNRPVPSYTLHSMFDDGTDLVRLSHHETNEWHPSVNNDGMVVYTRWDYVDRGAGQAHHAWTCFPDGRDPRELNGNTRIHLNTSPKMEMNVRQIPGSRKYVATSTPHHGWAAGSLLIIDPAVPDDGEMSAIRRLTPEQPFPEAEFFSWQNRMSGAYATAWPLGEKYFLCAYDGNANGLYAVKMRKRRYAITLLDAFGNKVRLWEHPTISCLDPMPMGARKRPPIIPHQTLEGRPADADGHRPEPFPPGDLPRVAEIGLINVYDTRIPFPSNETITALRVWQLYPKSNPLQQRPWLGAEPRQTGRQCLGTVPVESDGSAYFKAPANVPLFFQALRADGCAVQNMRSDTYVHPGERLVCSGCHEPKENVRRTALKNPPKAMRRAPSVIKPAPDGSAPFNYPRLVQPVLNAKCVSCHGEKRAPKAPDLRAGDWRKDKYGFSTSWKNLVDRTCYFLWEMKTGKKPANWEFVEPAYTRPGECLAIAAPLRKMLDAGHHGVKLTPEERERLITWMDSNGQYISHDRNPEDQRDGKVVPPAFE